MVDRVDHASHSLLTCLPQRTEVSKCTATAMSLSLSVCLSVWVCVYQSSNSSLAYLLVHSIYRRLVTLAFSAPCKYSYFLLNYTARLLAAQCIVIGPVCVFVCGGRAVSEPVRAQCLRLSKRFFITYLLTYLLSYYYYYCCFSWWWRCNFPILQVCHCVVSLSVFKPMLFSCV